MTYVCTDNHALLLTRAMRDAGLTLYEASRLLSLSPEMLQSLQCGARNVEHDEWDRIFSTIERYRTEGR